MQQEALTIRTLHVGAGRNDSDGIDGDDIASNGDQPKTINSVDNNPVKQASSSVQLKQTNVRRARAGRKQSMIMTALDTAPPTLPGPSQVNDDAVMGAVYLPPRPKLKFTINRQKPKNETGEYGTDQLEPHITSNGEKGFIPFSGTETSEKGLDEERDSLSVQVTSPLLLGTSPRSDTEENLDDLF